MAHTSVFIQAPDFPKLEGCEMIAGTYAESLRVAKGMGYDGVEIILGDPDQFDLGSFKALLLEHNLKISVIDSGGIQYLFNAALVRR
jgi:sugar phosphate isomerase/epimerase